MDPFTEKILERARERQRKLLEYNASGGIASLKEINNTKSLSAPSISDTTAVLKESNNTKSHSTPTINMKVTSEESNAVKDSSIQKINKVSVVSDSNISNDKNISHDMPLKGTVSEGNFSKLLRQNSKMNISSEIPGSPQLQLKTLNIQKENFNMEIKLCSAENVRIEVELQEESDDEGKENQTYQTKYEAGDGASNQPVIREDAKRRLQRLGRLYAGGEDADISSPIHRTEPTFSAEPDSFKSITKQKNIDETEHSKHLSKSHKGLGGLAALAKNINQWEDDLCKTKQPVSVEDNNKAVAEKKIDQGTRSPVKSIMKESTFVKAAVSNITSSPNKNTANKDPALLSVSERKALFEKNMGIAPIPKAPISMPTPLHLKKSKSKTDVKENETHISNITSHSTATTSSKPAPTAVEFTNKENSQVENSAKKFVKNIAPKPPIKPDAVDSSTYNIPSGHVSAIASKVAALFQNKTTISQQQIENDIREQRQKEMDVLLNRFHKNKEITQMKDISHHSESETEEEEEETNETTAMISAKPPQIIKKPQGIPPPPPLPGNKRRSAGKRCSIDDSPQVAAVLDDIKRIKVKDTKPGSLYPCLSDIEVTTETETERNTASPTPNNSSIEDSYDSDINAADTSFGREVLETVSKNTSQKRIYDESTASDISDILDEMDDYLDEAIGYKSPDKNGPTPPKQGRAVSPEDSSSSSSPFQYRSDSLKNHSPQKNKLEANDFRSPAKVIFSRKSTEHPVYVVDGDNVLPLTHTISFYRKQQTQGSKTPIRQVIRQAAIEESSENITSSSSSIDEENEVQEKIKSLMEDMTRQQTIISQTSRALNLCYATPEFTGSTEQVEAEKLLLLATHRRAAAQHEIERLSVLKTLHPENSLDEDVPLEKGSLTISNIILPLKREYVRALNATGGKGHHVVCLVKCAEQVHATQLVSTVATNDRNPNLELNIPGTIHLPNIYSNFTVHFEVYCLQAQEEVLPHEVKYHINKKSHSKLTPKKVKTESRLVRPPRESPGGPQAVRSPTFALMGYVVFSIQAINRKNWTLNNTPSMSPLEGIVEMRVKCELAVSVEHHGFLTMFEDVSGFGAWHRRWCLLKGHILSYWKYPEEEKKMTPIGSIDLKNCITQQIGSVRRDICARLHTILIETIRPAEAHDKDSLVMECKGDTTVIRHLLSADTREERIEWCSMFNKALGAMRMDSSSK